MEEVIAKRLASETKLQDALYRLIAFCKQERTYDEVAGEIATYPEMRGSAFPPSTILGWLVNVEAVQVVRDGSVEDEDGEADGPSTEVGEGQLDSKQAEESVEEIFVSTAAGLEALRCYQSVDRFASLNDQDGRYRPVFAELLQFCKDGQSKQAIEAKLKDNPLTYNPRVFPGYFLDRLEQSGALRWDGGWKTTEAGAEWLAAHEGAVMPIENK